MLREFCLAAILVLAFGIQDFDDTTGGRDAFEFIFHDRYDLLLTIFHNSCYYAYVADFLEGNLYLRSSRTNTEKHIKHLIQHHDSKVHRSDLDTVRNKFQDILADFHCADKTIYIIELDLDEVYTHKLNHGGHAHGRHGGLTGWLK